MRYEIYLTVRDEQAGYPQTKAALKTMGTDELTAEHKVMYRSCFGHNLFCGNARKAFNLIVDELIERGIEWIPGLFGRINLKRYEG